MFHMREHSQQLKSFLFIFTLKFVITESSGLLSESHLEYNENIDGINALNRTVRASSEDICTRLCSCVTEHIFLTANCDLLGNREYRFNSEWTISQTVTRLNIHLGQKTKFYLEETIFNNNKINHVAINGSFFRHNYKNGYNGEEFVLIEKKAFRGINAPLPEIILHNLNTIVLNDFAFSDITRGGEFILTINDTKNVFVHSKTFVNTTFHAKLFEIDELLLKENAFSGSMSSKVAIDNAYLKELNRITANLKELKIENSKIEIIKSNALDVLSLDSLILSNVKIDEIESNALTEKVLAKHVAVINCDIGSLAPKALNGFGTEKFKFERNRVKQINEQSLHFVGVEISVSHNVIKKLQPNWFQCKDWNNITIYNNSFGDFHHMFIDSSRTEGRRCDFHHNTMTLSSDDSFRTLKRQCHLTDLIFYKECTCDFTTWLSKIFRDSKQNFIGLRKESNCRIESTLMYCFKSEIIKFDQYHERICDKSSKDLDCKKPIDTKNVTFIRPHELNGTGSWKDYIYHIIVGVGTLAAIILVVFSYILCQIKCQCSKSAINSDTEDYVTNVTNPEIMTLPLTEGPPSYQASIRVMKTFSNKDQTIIKKTLETMKEKQPADKYEIVNTNTQRLLNETLNEYEKVRLIGDIVQVIGDCENCGEDFVAFTDILYKHLAPDNGKNIVPVPVTQTLPYMTNTGEVLYSEPVLHQPQTQVSQQNSMRPRQTSDPIADPKLNEHIYAEPTNLMQQQTMMPLLLANNYSSPLDDNLNSAEYSEPVMIAISPYAISQDIQQQPSTSKNLPDIVSRNPICEAGPSEINRINRSPTTNRKIPEYTVPSHHLKKPIKITQDDMEDWSDESLENSTSSNHSGGSGATVKIDDIVSYPGKRP